MHLGKAVFLSIADDFELNKAVTNRQGSLLRQMLCTPLYLHWLSPNTIQLLPIQLRLSPDPQVLSLNLNQRNSQNHKNFVQFKPGYYLV